MTYTPLIDLSSKDISSKQCLTCNSNYCIVLFKDIYFILVCSQGVYAYIRAINNTYVTSKFNKIMKLYGFIKDILKLNKETSI